MNSTKPPRTGGPPRNGGKGGKGGKGRAGSPRSQSRDTRPTARVTHPDVTVTVERLVPGGVGLARDGSGVVFVRGGLPGEEVLAAVDKKRGGVRHGHVLRVLSPSPSRIEPDCAVHPECGGCDLLDLAPTGRPKIKTELVADVLRRIARLRDDHETFLAPLRLPDDAAEGLRRRARAHVGKNGSLGFFARSSHVVIDTEICRSLVPALHPAWEFVRQAKLAEGSSVEFLAAPDGSVFLASSPENADALTAAVDEGIAVGACAYADFGQDIDDGLETKAAEAIADEIFAEAHFFVGDRGVAEVIAPYAFGGPYGVDAAAFTQASPFGARAIVEEVVFAAFADDDALTPEGDAVAFIESGPTAAPTTRVLELFAGAGHLSFPLASAGVHVTAVEGAPISAGWLAANAETFAASEPPGAGHVTAVAAYISPADLAPEIARDCDADILVADPPRTGIPDAEKLFAQCSATRLVLVSCDLATGARDLRKAIDAGFSLKRLVPIDAFSRTSHLEWVATLTRPPRPAAAPPAPPPDTPPSS